VAEDRRHEGGHADRHEDQDVRHALLPATTKSESGTVLPEAVRASGPNVAKHKKH
jgi:hypothetical protein